MVTIKKPLIDAQTLEIRKLELEEAMRTADNEQFWKLADKWQALMEQEYKRQAFRNKPR